MDFSVKDIPFSAAVERMGLHACSVTQSIFSWFHVYFCLT